MLPERGSVSTSTGGMGGRGGGVAVAVGCGVFPGREQDERIRRMIMLMRQEYLNGFMSVSYGYQYIHYTSPHMDRMIHLLIRGASI
jgi:hypothetical protein